MPQGCDYINRCGFYLCSSYPFGYDGWLYLYRRGSISHIGVGSDVVCSTLIGNARASDCGMDNRMVHAFLCPDFFCLE